MSSKLLRCAGCSELIEKSDVKKKRIIGLLDRLWHSDHIFCVYCKSRIADNRVFRSACDPLMPACYECHIQSTFPACTACLEPLAEYATHAKGVLYHQKCFRCVVCRQIIGKGRGYYEKEGIILDQNCFMKYCRGNPENK